MIKDSARPYIEQKDVILCRSGIQLYHRSEVANFIVDGNKPVVDKEWYREYRPSNVVVKAVKKCKSLPVTKEHPSDWVSPDNFNMLAGGVTDKGVEVVALDGESEGEIGLKSNLTFYNRELHDYYEANNKEVSLGYTCRKHWVENPEEVGYDIVLDEIIDVNHLAITRAGRGGSSVAVIDSILGGQKKMLSSLFSWLKQKKVTDSVYSLGESLFDALGDEKKINAVIDSVSVFKDGARKSLLINAIKDCFEHKEEALKEKEGIVATLDNIYNALVADSTEEIEGACSKEEEKAKEDACNEDKEISEKADEVKDTEEVKEEKKEEEISEKADEVKDTEEVKEEKAEDTMNRDSIVALVKETVASAVKEVLGVKDSIAIDGGAIDEVKEISNNIDYASFLDK